MPDSARTQTGKRLFRSSLTVGAMTMISRVAGLVRDVVLATMFGAAANADAFYIAFRIPQFLRRLFAEGAFSQAFVPVLSEYRATRSVAEVKVLVDAVSGVLGAALQWPVRFLTLQWIPQTLRGLMFLLIGMAIGFAVTRLLSRLSRLSRLGRARQS